MVHRNEFHLEGSNLLYVAFNNHVGVSTDPMFLELGFNERNCQLGADDGDIGAQFQEVGNRADMILVAVGKNDGLNVLDSVLEVIDVREDEVNARLAFFGEEDPAINYYQLASIFEDVAVSPNFAKSSEWNNPNSIFGGGRGHHMVSHPTIVSCKRSICLIGCERDLLDRLLPCLNIGEISKVTRHFGHHSRGRNS